MSHGHDGKLRKQTTGYFPMRPTLITGDDLSCKFFRRKREINMNKQLRTAAVISFAVVAGVAGVAALAGAADGPPTAAAAEKSGACAADQDEIRAVPERIVAGWAANDADAIAAVFTKDTDFVIGDGTFLRGRDQVREYMADAFAGFLKDSRVSAPVESVRCLSPKVGVVHTLGGILLPGETEVPPERQGVQVFVITKQGGDWLVDVYQNTRISTAE